MTLDNFQLKRDCASGLQNILKTLLMTPIKLARVAPLNPSKPFALFLSQPRENGQLESDADSSKGSSGTERTDR